MSDAGPVQGAVTGVRCVEIGVEVHVDEPNPRAGRVRSGDRSQLHSTIAAQDEHVFLRCDRRRHVACDQVTGVAHGLQVHGLRPRRIRSPAERCNIAMIPDGSASARERLCEPMPPKGRGRLFLPRRIGGGGADDVQQTLRQSKLRSFGPAAKRVERGDRVPRGHGEFVPGIRRPAGRWTCTKSPPLLQSRSGDNHGGSENAMKKSAPKDARRPLPLS